MKVIFQTAARAILLRLLPCLCGLMSATLAAWAGQPYASTLPATVIAQTNFVLNGFATPNDSAATAWFEWGPSAAYGNQTPSVGAAGNMVLFLTNRVSALTAGSPCHYRLVVSNSVGVACGADQLFGVSKSAVAWGYDAWGQTNVPAGAKNLVALASGRDHTLAVRNDGTLVAWGLNWYHQTNAPTFSIATAVACGQYHNVVLKNDGSVMAWGDNRYGQSGVSSTLTNAVAVAAGGFHSLALRRDGTVAAWGANFYWQTTVPPGLSNVVAVAAGGDIYGVGHSLALKSDGTTAVGFVSVL